MWKTTVFPPLASISGAGQQMPRTAVKGGTRNLLWGEDLDGQRHLLKSRQEARGGKRGARHAERDGACAAACGGDVRGRVAEDQAARPCRCDGGSNRNRKANAAVPVEDTGKPQ